MIAAIPEHLRDVPFDRLPPSILAAAVIELGVRLAEMVQAAGILRDLAEAAYDRLEEGDAEAAKLTLEGPARTWWGDHVER